jgi:hypothetical protein
MPYQSMLTVFLLSGISETRENKRHLHGVPCRCLRDLRSADFYRLREPLVSGNPRPSSVPQRLSLGRMSGLKAAGQL